MDAFFRFFAKRHALAMVLTIMTILLGLNTLSHIKRDIFPYVDFGIMQIITVYPGASPEDVEINVTNKIEKELETVSGIERFTSLSAENSSVIHVFVDPDERDPSKVKTQIREAVGKVTGLPKEVKETPFVREIDNSVMPVIEVGLTGKNVSYKELRELAKRFSKQLEVIDGVARMDKFGYRAREIKIEVSPKAVTKYQLPLQQIITAIKLRNIRTTAGSFESYTSEKNLVTLAQFKDPLEVGDVIISPASDGSLVRVKDLALVSDDFEDERILTRMNGKPAISFLVFKTLSADAIRVVDAIKEVAEGFKSQLPENVSLEFTYDSSKYVRTSFRTVLNNLLMGLGFVLVLLTVFLPIRTSFWVAVGIPVSLLGTIFLLPFFNVFLDTVTLIAMIIIIGIIVDDAIIVAENISRHRERGEEPIDAAVLGIKEVFSPVMATVLTTFLAFAPMFFMTGLFGKFIVVIPLVITLALGISLSEVALALPAHMLPGLKHHSKASMRSRWFEFLRGHYRRFLMPVLRFRYVAALIALVVFVGSLAYASFFIKFILFPSEMANDFYVFADLPTGTSLKNTSNKAQELEEVIMSLPRDELVSVTTRIGYNLMLETEDESYAWLYVNLAPYAKRDRTVDEIVAELRKKTDSMAGFDKISYMIEAGGPPVGKPVNIQIVGSDDAMRSELADRVEEFLHSLEGVQDIERDDKPGKKQLEIVINYEKLSLMGLTVADVAQNIRIAYDGEVVTSVRYGDEEVDFRVIFEEEARHSSEVLKDLAIPNREGQFVTLNEVARFEGSPGPSDYRHHNGERTITIEAEVDKNVITPLEVNDAVFEQFDVARDWPGLRFNVGGEIYETQKSVTNLMRTMLFAVIGIYFLLIVLFNSTTQPFIVLLAIPFGIIGVIVTFALHNEPLGFTAMLGVIGLAGVVVNDSLILVSHINELKRRRHDEPIMNIVAEGTADRLRAIIITTLTTVAGLLPLAYGFGGSDPFMAPMALALGYGLVLATPLTLVLVPCFYLIGQDIHRLWKKIIQPVDRLWGIFKSRQKQLS